MSLKGPVSELGLHVPIEVDSGDDGTGDGGTGDDGTGDDGTGDDVRMKDADFRSIAAYLHSACVQKWIIFHCGKLHMDYFCYLLYSFQIFILANAHFICFVPVISLLIDCMKGDISIE